MNYPLLPEYIEAIKSAEDNFDKLKSLRPVFDESGEPTMTSGNFAVVFKMKDEQTGKLHAVKCFLKEQEHREESYRLIADELEFVSSTFLTPIKYLEKELFVDSRSCSDTEFPVVLMDWVEGVTLDKYIREHDDAYELALLAYQFSRLAMWLLSQPFAHGDLKPDNILVRTDGSLALVDYDGMYVPAMKGQKARELGSPDFRHPSRTENDFNEHIDDFSLVSILLSIKALSLNPELMGKYAAADHLLFSEKDYRDISHCSLLKELYPSADAEQIVLISLFTLAVVKGDLADVSARLFNLARPKAQKNGTHKLQYIANRETTEALNDLGEKYYKAQDYKKAVEWYTKAAEQGDARAQCNLGYCYENGRGVEQDYQKAVEWYTKAAEQGYASAQNNLRCCYVLWLGVEKDNKKAFEWITKTAEQGYASAQFNLGYCYDRGLGVENDYQKAVEWYTKAAEQGYADAQLKLGVCYELSRGVERDYQKAVALFKKAAEQGYARAQYKLGECYYLGKQDYRLVVKTPILKTHGFYINYSEPKTNQVVEQDYQKAVEWYTKAAEQGYARAQYNLGDCYKNGRGVEQDYQKAVEWYTKAAEQGDETAQCNLGNCYKNGQGVEQNYQKAVEWFTKAAVRWYANAIAQYNLGVCYENGQGVEQDYQKAVEWYTKAAEQRDARAQFNLGYCYEYGQGVEKDYQKAVEWYTKAAEQGNADAQLNLGVCYEIGQGVEKDYQKAVEWYTKAAEQGNERAKSSLNRLKNKNL
ncbi:MAG: SEL1-like repeat protein [Bacteroidales bacterium]|nr:SEL1-like repeat protein [Bacteroidales bacterium]